jgi:Sugar phosphate isomerases/epimerases
VADIAAECAANGISAVEINLADLAADFDGVTALLRKSGLGVSCVWQHHDYGEAADMDAVHTFIDTAAACGAKNVLSVPGFLPADEARALAALHTSYEDTAAFMQASPRVTNMVTALKEMVRYGAEKGITVTLEDFDNFIAPYSQMYELLWFMQSVPGLKLAFDTGNFAYAYEDATLAYEVLKAHIVHFHCKDRRYAPELGERARMSAVRVGGGYLPLKTLLKRHLATGYDGFLAIEHFDHPDQRTAMRESAEFLRGL